MAACLLTTAVLVQIVPGPAVSQAEAAKGDISEYRMPPATYDGWVKSSEYVTVRDGTRLAIDVYRPTRDGVVASGPLPVVMSATPYHRDNGDSTQLSFSANIVKGHDAYGSVPLELIKHGYVMASLDIRGRGASFGRAVVTNFSDTERNDLYDVVEWLGHQSWSTGKVGMIGCSYTGNTQLWAASSAAPSLKTITASAFQIDTYPAFIVNGVPQTSFFDSYSKMMYTLDVTQAGPAVDSDKDGRLLAAAVEDHKHGWDEGSPLVQKLREVAPFRFDPVANAHLARPLGDHYNLIPNMRMAGVSELQFAGWQDINIDQAFEFYGTAAKTGMPQRMIIGPWRHCEWYGSDKYDAALEHLRWFDYWLKGIQNGVSSQPPIVYYMSGAPAGAEWRTAARWPVTGFEPKTLFLSASSASRFSGKLVAAGSQQEGSHSYTVNYESSASSIAGRFNFFEWLGRNPTMDSAVLVRDATLFTTEPLTQDAEILGYPVVRLWVSSTAPDQDFFFYLESVDPAGNAEVIGDGAIRASNRATRSAPYENFGLPWHPGIRADQRPLIKDRADVLEVALMPMAQRVPKGNRLRLAITNFDKGNFDTPIVSPPPKVTVYFDKMHPSTLTLPVKELNR